MPQSLAQTKCSELHHHSFRRPSFVPLSGPHLSVVFRDNHLAYSTENDDTNQIYLSFPKISLSTLKISQELPNQLTWSITLKHALKAYHK